MSTENSQEFFLLNGFTSGCRSCTLGVYQGKGEAAMGKPVKKTVGMMIDATPCVATVTMRRDTYRSGAKPRLFVDGSVLTPSWDMPPYGSKRGDGSDADKAWRRYNREELRLRRQVLKRLGLTGRYSRKAGCPCQCSPGFVIDSLSGWTTWVDVEPMKF